MQLKAHYSSRANQNPRKRSYKNINLKTCNSSHHRELMQSMHLKLINSPHSRQKAIKRGHSHHSKAWWCTRHANPKERKLCKVAKKTSPLLKKFYSEYHYKVTKVPWGAITPKPFSFCFQGLNVAFQPVYLDFYWIYDLLLVFIF